VFACSSQEERRGVFLPQRRDRPGHLPRESERLPAGGEDPECGASLEQFLHQLCHRGDQVLAVVENQQQLAPGELVDRRLGAAPAGVLDQSENPPHRRDHRGVVGERPELDQPDAVGLLGTGGELEGDARLAGATGSGESDQTSLGPRLG